MNGSLYEDTASTRGLEPAGQTPLHIPAKRVATTLAVSTYPHPPECPTGPDSGAAAGVIRHSHSTQPWNYQPDHAAATAPFDSQYGQTFYRDGVTPTYYNIADSRMADRKALAFWPNKCEYAPGPSSMATESCQAFAAQTWCNYPPYGRVGHVDAHGQPVPYLTAADGAPKSAVEAAAGYPHDGYLRNYPTTESMPPAPYPPAHRPPFPVSHPDVNWLYGAKGNPLVVNQSGALHVTMQENWTVTLAGDADQSTDDKPRASHLARSRAVTCNI